MSHLSHAATQETETLISALFAISLPFPPVAFQTPLDPPAAVPRRGKGIFFCFRQERLVTVGKRCLRVRLRLGAHSTLRQSQQRYRPSGHSLCLYWKVLWPAPACRYPSPTNARARLPLTLPTVMSPPRPHSADDDSCYHCSLRYSCTHPLQPPRF